MERELPIIQIEGTAFIVDVAKDELREQEHPENVIPFSDMSDKSTHYLFEYDKEIRNTPMWNDESVYVELPPLKVLDPVGMAEHYGKTPEEIRAKTDYEIIVDQQLVDRRLGGLLPVIEIAGHPFFVDLRMGSLRPMDDFSTAGILFTEIEDCMLEDGRSYWIPYDPATHQYVAIDYREITKIPKGIVMVEIPNEERLDPIGYSQLHGFDAEPILRANPIEHTMKARIVSWDETPIEMIIKENVQKSGNQQEDLPEQNEQKPKRKKGRRI